MPDISGSTILITGGSGFIGSHTVDRLIREDIERIVIFDKVINEKNLVDARKSKKVRVIQGDISNPGDVDSAMKGVDIVFHFAGILLNPSAENPRACLISNINGMFNMLEAFTKYKVTRLIYSSSVAVYMGSKNRRLIKEDHPLNSRTMYGASKIVGEQFCRVFNEMTGLNYLALRYSSAYGPRQHYEGLYTRQIMQSLDRIEKGLCPQIQGTGEEVHDFIYIDDVVEATILALKSDLSDEPITIASGKPKTHKELIQTLIDLTNPRLTIDFLPPSSHMPIPYRVFSIEKARRLLGFKPKIDLGTGLKKLIEWKKQLSR